MKNIKISILTDPIPYGRSFVLSHGKFVLRLLRNLILHPKSYYYGSNYGGHPSVTRSLIMGFKKCNISFNYNPKKKSNLCQNVIVLAGVKTLKQAIYLKKKGYIKKIFAGPNITTFAKDENYLLGSPEIDLVIVPSNWVRSIYLKDLPILEKKIYIWPAGVDTNYWAPKSNNFKNTILIYDKINGLDNNKLKPYINVLKSLSLNYKIISPAKNYRYTSKKFRELLDSSILMIGLTKSESQGICWVEAWSMNVPTLINFQSSNFIIDRKVFTSTAPYLSSDTGLFFYNLKDFEEKFIEILNNSQKFSPRKWVCQNMSDKVIAMKIYKKILSC